jgi:hypothetical protein
MSCMSTGCSTYSREAGRIFERMRIAVDGLHTSLASTLRRRARTDRFPGPQDKLDVASLVDADLVIDGLETASDCRHGPLGHHSDITVRRHEIHGIELGSDGAAHELVNLLLQEFAQRIPASHVEAADHEARRSFERVPARTHS